MKLQPTIPGLFEAITKRGPARGRAPQPLKEQVEQLRGGVCRLQLEVSLLQIIIEKGERR